MSSFSGLSAILTVSLVALVTMQILKDKFEMIENYGPVDDVPYTSTDVSSTTNARQKRVEIPVLNTNLQNAQGHTTQPFVPGSSPYTQPSIGRDANRWNATPDSLQVFYAQTAAATPTPEMLNNISSTMHLPGPNEYSKDVYATANVNSDRTNNLSLCAQNASTFGAGHGSVASSLLPKNTSDKLEGFSDCNFNNSLANQVFLTNQTGFNTTSGSNKNANKDLRAAPPCPINVVSPWSNSTVYPDLLTRPLNDSSPSFGQYGTGPNSVVTPSKILG